MTEIIKSLEEAGKKRGRAVVTIGNFDGMHIGHQAIFAEAVSEARERGIESVALTFEPHPVAFFRPDDAPLRLAPVPFKFDLMAAYGVDRIVALPFDGAIAGQSPRAFIEEILIGALGAVHVVVGEDFRFGKRRAGDVTSLQAIGGEHGMTAVGATRVRWGGEVVGSSRIRRAVVGGRLSEVEAMLGRKYRLYGEVIHGDARGREMGYPTANLATRQMPIPPDGIYVSRLARRGETPWKAATSIGVRPTFGVGERTIETYVLDEEVPGEGLNLYDEWVELELCKFLREELKFESAEALIAQMDRDVEETRTYFREVYGARSGAKNC